MRLYVSRALAAPAWVLAAFAGQLAIAQTTGSLEGLVVDTGGVPLPGVTLEARSPSLQGTRVTISDTGGKFRFPGVPPGRYRVAARLQGFVPAESEVEVPLDKTAALDLTLKLEIRTDVVVSGETPPIDFTSTTTGTNYKSSLTEHLPAGRNYADIVRANPGVTTDRGETQGRSLALSIYGASSAENQWIIDGVDTTNVIKGIQGKAINTEFVEEVQVKTGGYEAEYGRALGGIVNVVTKSGGNAFHGDAFIYSDRFDWQANQRVTTQSDSVATGMRITNYKKTDFGADLGGPILKDRLWFFLAADRVDQPAQVSRYTDSALVPASQRFPLDATDSLYSGKLTFRVGSGTTLVATAFSDPTTNSGAGFADPRQSSAAIRDITNPDPGTWETTRHIGATDLSLRLEQLFGATAFATLQAARHRDRFELIPTGDASAARFEDWTCPGGTSANPCVPPPGPNVVAGGLGFVFGPTNRNSSGRDHLRGDVLLFLGSHELKLGGDVQRETTTSTTAFSGGQLVQRFNQTGVTYYKHTFFAASPNDLTSVDSVMEPRTINAGAFLQDSWRPLSGLTINAGFRWDRQDISDYRGETVIETDLWQPRLGIVWDPKGDGKTKLYAFAGRFSYALPTDISRAFSNSTFANTYNFDPLSVTQDSTVPGHPVPIVRSINSAEPVDGGLGAGYQDEFIAGVERLVRPWLTLGLKGTYRRLGRIIEDRCDLDPDAPENNGNVCGIMNPGSDGPIARGAVGGCNVLDPICDTTTPTLPPSPTASRIYRGIELLARASVGNRLWAQVSYVYSSLRGNYDGGVRADGQTDPGINYDFDYPQLYVNGYGRLNLDRPHSFRFDGTWTAPFGLFAGLQVFVQSGAPTDRLGYLNEFSYGGEGVFLVPRGSEGRMPTQWEANLTLGYPLHVGPLLATLQVYVFNLFNNQIALARDNGWSIAPPSGYPATLFDPNQEQNNPDYGKVTARQSPRLVRAAVRVSF